MKNNIILSIFICTFNRCDTLLALINKILLCKTDKIQIVVLDDASTDGTEAALVSLDSEKVKYIRNSTNEGLSVGVLHNWYKALEECEGLFSFHLNDRDNINPDKIDALVDFLEINKTLAGGICIYKGRYKIYSSRNKSLLNVPYNAVHPSGHVFNMTYYRQIENRKKLFTKEASYIHPHDLVLAELAIKGNLFLFDRTVWSLSNDLSFKTNKSFLFKRTDISNIWFSPKARFEEYRLFILHLISLNVSLNIKKAKIKKITRRYLEYCTFDYAFFMKNEGQAAHYGYTPKVLSLNDLVKEKNSFIEQCSVFLNGIAEGNYNFIFKIQLNCFFWYKRLFYKLHHVIFRFLNIFNMSNK